MRTDGPDITGQMQVTGLTIARATGTPCRGWFCQGGKALAACAAAAAISDLLDARVVPHHANASGRSASCVCSIVTAPPLTVTSNRLRTGGPGQETNGHLEEVFIRVRGMQHHLWRGGSRWRRPRFIPLAHL